MKEERRQATLACDGDSDGPETATLLEEDDRARKFNMATEFWAEIYTKNSIERAAHILDLIYKKWLVSAHSLDETPSPTKRI